MKPALLTFAAGAALAASVIAGSAGASSASVRPLHVAAPVCSGPRSGSHEPIRQEPLPQRADRERYRHPRVGKPKADLAAGEEQARWAGARPLWLLALSLALGRHQVSAPLYDLIRRDR